MTATLIRGATILTMNPRREILANADLLVDGGRIAALGRIAADAVPADAAIVDAKGLVMMPGLVNGHVHGSQQLGRGIADDVDLLTWLRDRVWPFEHALTEDDQLVSMRAVGLEMIRTGVTTIAEAGGQHVDASGRALLELGLRAILCQSAMDCGEGLPPGWVLPTSAMLELQIGQHERWHGAGGGRLRHWFGLRTVFNCSDALIRRTKEEADRRGTSIQMHVAEIPEENRFCTETRGASTAEHLERLGVLGPNLLAIHCVWLSPHEVELFAERAVPVIHCPSANMRVLGFAPIPELLARGVAVGLGTDSPPCCNRGDMFDEIYLAALIHKGRRGDPTVMPAETLLEMATIGGARCLGWDDEIGSLEPGKKADLILIDPRDVGSLPVHDIVSTLVYAMHARCVVSTMCDGRWLMRDRMVLTLDEPALLTEIQRRAEQVRERAGIRLPARFPIVSPR
jgi:5-methylthioadenosine/S-adenosylhomocysteine deaminase